MSQPTLPPSQISFFGSPIFAVPILERLAENFAIKLVISQPSKKTGSSQRIQSTAVAAKAETLGLPLATPAKLSDPDFRELIEAIQVDVAVVAAYGKILPKWLLDWPRLGMINVHGSLLPAYRGASPIAAAIADQQDQTGITMMQMDVGMDEGPILKQFICPITPGDTTASLSDKLSRLAADQIVDTVQEYVAGRLSSRPQPPAGVSYTKLLTTADGRVDLDDLPSTIEALCRAYYPWPGVWTIWQGKRLKLLPGNMVQLEGKRPTSIADFRRGHPTFPTTVLG
jgi:methionyl-tRNA formyltransferase